MNKNKIGASLSSIVLVVVTIGITYAWLTQTLIGEKVHSMRVGNFRFNLSEENSLTLESGEFMSDEDGLAQTGYKFSVENIGKGYGSYSIYLDDDTISSNATRLDDKFIKYSLETNGSKNTPISLTSRKIYSDGLANGEKDIFVLRLWLNKDVDGDVGGQEFRVKLRVEVNQVVPTPVAEKLLSGVGDKGAIDTSDFEQTFITGTNPNNYIWYSGKLWRAVSIDPSDNSVKLVTQWNISAIPYNSSGNTSFKDSYMEQWLNDTSVDGFLGNLREPDKFIKTDSVWNATMTTDTTKPAKTTMITDTVGLLNIYEYVKSGQSYLNNGLFWWTLTPYNFSNVRLVYNNGYGNSSDVAGSNGCRPAINIKSTVKIIDGDGTSNNPYRLDGDNDSPTGVLLSTRYSGEYIRFGTGENNLYRIVSHENMTGTKITSAIPLKENSSNKIITFGNNVTYSKNNTIGIFLNGDYLTSSTYLTSNQTNMIEDNTTWYLGTVGLAENYKLAKYQDTTSNNLTVTTIAKVGLLRLGEMMSGQSDRYNNNAIYWLLTRYSNSTVRDIDNDGNSSSDLINSYSIKPAMNLKPNVVITGGDGTMNSPYTIELSSS